MTKEELLKKRLDNEARFYTKGWKEQENCVQAYLAGAEPREKRIVELEAQIEKMKCCENCAWWYKLPNGQRDCAEECENHSNWSLRR